MLTPDLQTAIVSDANLAPSVHNTQPARWRFSANGIEIWADQKRFLAVGDPLLHDAALSCGAALEGTVMALAERGLKAVQVQDLWSDETTSADGLRLCARLQVEDGASPDALNAFIRQRFTWRGAFHPAASQHLDQFERAIASLGVCTVIRSPADVEWLADVNDDLSLKFFSDKAYRNELRFWMRLSRAHPEWDVDGLSAEAMQMSAFEATGARVALASPVFEMLKAIGVARSLISERSKTRSASGIVLFHTPIDVSPVDAGRSFYRMWLELTRASLSAWPMAVVADDPGSNSACQARFAIPQDHRLINLLRVGTCENPGARPDTARLPVDKLIVA